MLYFSARLACGLLALLALNLFVVTPRESLAVPLQNSDFAAGLSGWSSAGNVSVIVEEAVLSDAEDVGTNPFARLYQVADVTVGQSYNLSFDYLGRFAEYDGEIDQFSFPDTFYATLLSGDQPSDLDPDAPLGSADALFDLSADGATNYLGSTASSPKGDGWVRYGYNFVAANAFLSVLFELDELNFILGDAAVRIDNVTITENKTEVPEPATVALLLFGAPILRRRWKVNRL